MLVQDPVRHAIYFNELAPVVETPVTETTMFETFSADVFNAPEDEEKTKTPGGQTISNSRNKTTGKLFFMRIPVGTSNLTTTTTWT